MEASFGSICFFSIKLLFLIAAEILVKYLFVFGLTPYLFSSIVDHTMVVNTLNVTSGGHVFRISFGGTCTFHYFLDNLWLNSEHLFFSRRPPASLLPPAIVRNLLIQIFGFECRLWRLILLVFCFFLWLYQSLVNSVNFLPHLCETLLLVLHSCGSLWKLR